MLSCFVVKKNSYLIQEHHHQFVTTDSLRIISQQQLTKAS